MPVTPDYENNLISSHISPPENSERSDNEANSADLSITRKIESINNNPEYLYYNNNDSHLEEKGENFWSFMANFFSAPGGGKRLI